MKLNDIIANANGVGQATSEAPLPPAHGSEATRDNKTKVTCPCCHGSGTQHSTKSGMREICPGCDARGWIENPNL